MLGKVKMNVLVDKENNIPNMKKIMEQSCFSKEKEFEDLLANKDIDDPLENWILYLEWSQKNQPLKVKDIIERIQTEFIDDPRYKNSPKLLNVWLKLTEFSMDTLPIFKTLQELDLFQDLALFYESFGALLEKSSKFEEAYEMIQKGIARNALPINRLKKSFEQMKSRIPILGQKQQVQENNSLKRKEIPLSSKDSTPKKSKVDEKLNASKKESMDIPPKNEKRGYNFEILLMGTSSELSFEEIRARNPKYQQKNSPKSPKIEPQSQQFYQSQSQSQSQNQNQNQIESHQKSKVEISLPSQPQPQPQPQLQSQSQFQSQPSQIRKQRRKSSLAFASPTANMKYALAEIESMFRQPFQFETERLENEFNEPQPKKVLNFEILEENTTQFERNQLNNKRSSFSVFEENMKNDARISQPKKGLNFEILEENTTQFERNHFDQKKTTFSVFDEENIKNDAQAPPQPKKGLSFEILEENTTQFQKNDFNQNLPLKPRSPIDSGLKSSISFSPLATTKPPSSNNLLSMNLSAIVSSSPSTNFSSNSFTFPDISSVNYDPGPKESTRVLKQENEVLNDSYFIDPFCYETVDDFLQRSDPLDESCGFYSFTNKDRNLYHLVEKLNATNANEVNIQLNLEKKSFQVYQKLGQGSSGTVFLVSDIDEGEDGDSYALKFQKPAFPWEYYVSYELSKRISPQHQSRIVLPKSIHVYRDESYYVTEFCPHGTLGHLLKFYSYQEKGMDELIAIFYLTELLQVVQAVHNADIVHGDIKADNLLIVSEEIDPKNWGSHYNPNGEEGWGSKGLKLFDFGRSIDLTILSPGAVFRVGTYDSDALHILQSIRGDSQWKYEIDYYGICVIAHYLMFNEDLKIQFCENSRKWKPFLPMKQQWSPLWELLFTSLLNTSPCEQVQPSLSDICKQFQQHLMNSKSKSLKGLLRQQEVEQYESGMYN